MKYMDNVITEKPNQWWYKTLTKRYTDFIHSVKYDNMITNPEQYQEAIRRRTKEYCLANNSKGHLRDIYLIALKESNENLIIYIRQNSSMKTFLAIMQNI